MDEVSYLQRARACDISFVHAVWDRNVEDVRRWLQNGYSACTRRINGDCLIHFAARANDIDMVRLLISFRANANEQNRHLYTPLHMAVQWKDVTLAKLLLKNGAYPSIASDQGITRLAIAAYFSHYKMAKILLNNGAIVSKKLFVSSTLADHSVMGFRENLHILEKSKTRNGQWIQTCFLTWLHQNKYCAKHATRRKRCVTLNCKVCRY